MGWSVSEEEEEAIRPVLSCLLADMSFGIRFYVRHTAVVPVQLCWCSRETGRISTHTPIRPL